MGVKGKINVQEYVYDFAVDGGTKDANIALHAKDGKAALPIGSIVMDVVAQVVTQPTSAGSATVSWGSEDDEDGYSGTTIAIASLTDNSIWSRGVQGSEALIWDDTNDHPIHPYIGTANQAEFNVLISTADLTAGKIVFTVTYIEPGIDA